jgi:benzylsuccinate CoA-transferase BbsF subunit
MASLSHEGRGGPHGEVPGAGPALSALSGLIELTGWTDRPPVTLPAFGILPDYIAPRFGLFAILTAVDYRRRTGKGQYIDFSEYEASIQFQIPAILDYTANNRILTRNGNKSAYAAPHGMYPCRGEDTWCAIAVFSEVQWEAFCKVLENPLWTRDPKFDNMSKRLENADELNALVAKWIQFNVIGREKLLEAQKTPDDYQDLIVRVVGYSSYFAELGKGVQDDIIRRTEVCI